ncbi:MAG: transposase [Sphingobacteriales bacterium]|nr:MAG: transposase [Sphingobacteriales bacterium]
MKYNYFHHEQKKAQKNNPFLVQNLYYNKQEDYYVCPMDKRMEFAGKGKRISSNGYESELHYYEAKHCEGCPMREMCHNSPGNRRMEVSHNLNRHRDRARELLTSPKGLYYRSKRPVEVEAAFGQMKSNNKFTRFTLRGLDKVAIEFGLMAIGHNLRKLAKKKGNAQKNGQNPSYTDQNQAIVLHFIIFDSAWDIAA